MPTVSTSLDLEDINLPSEVTQAEKGKCHVTSVTRGIEKQHKLNYFTKKKQTPRFRKQTYAYHSGKMQAEEKVRKFALTSTHKYTYIYIFLK